MIFLISASFTRPTITCDVMPPSVPASVTSTAIIRTVKKRKTTLDLKLQLHDNVPTYYLIYREIKQLLENTYIILALSYSEAFYYDKVRLNLPRLNLKYCKLKRGNLLLIGISHVCTNISVNNIKNRSTF